MNLIFRLTYALLTVMILCIPSSLFSQQKEELRLFHMWDSWGDSGMMLRNYLNKQAFYYLDKRDSLVKTFKTADDWKNRQKVVRKAMLADIGAFPERTPLNAKIINVVRKEGFRIEKILFESMPGNYVAGCLFIPDDIKGRRPAILHVTGHSTAGFTFASYQRLYLNLVKKGFIVLAIDPPGQGERLQYFDPEKEQSVIPDGPTREHTYAGLQCFLTGESIAKYFIWDGMRAIDYLVSRPEVDVSRIGITGRSGGGTQTAYISAFDDRIVAAAPEDYFTSHRRLLESRGPQDAEQNFYHWLSDGTAIDDLLVMRIPRPTLLVTTTRDIFSIQGTRELYKEISKGYAAFGQEGNFAMVEDHADHASTKRNREAIYRFFQKHLSLPGNSVDEDVTILKPEELHVTTTGQISSSVGGETVFSLNKKVADRLHQKIIASREKNLGHLEFVRERSAALSGYRVPARDMEVVYRGSYQRDGYTVGMYALHGEGGYPRPLLLALPDGEAKHPAVIYIHSDGKEQGIPPGGNIEKIVKQGYIVAAPDLSGIGELKPDVRFAAEASFGAILVGRSIVGIKAADVVSVVNFLKGLPNVNTDDLRAIAFGEECPALLHAAVFEPSISNVALLQAPVSYYNITQSKMYDVSQSFDWGVAGALTAYDLPDLAACLSPRKLSFVELHGVKDGSKPNDLVREEMDFAKSVFVQKAPGNLQIMSMPEEGIEEFFTSWLGKQ